ncbi:MAG: hypothetical protein U0U70_13180 [Chitinophagaceae bacterium]
MTTGLKILSVIVLYLTASCTGHRSSGPDYDKAVLKEIFPSLLDSIYVEITFSMTPPRIAEVVDSLTGKIEIKPVAKGATDKDLIRNSLNSYVRDSNYIIIVLRDSVHALSNDDLDIFRSKYPVINDTTKTSYLRGSYLVPLNDLTVRNCFRLKLSSEYRPATRDSMIFVRQLKEISFSRIIFDSDKIHGMLTCEYVCGGLCGEGYRVYIKNQEGKWTIRFIEHAWVS